MSKLVFGAEILSVALTYRNSIVDRRNVGQSAPVPASNWRLAKCASDCISRKKLTVLVLLAALFGSAIVVVSCESSPGTLATQGVGELTYKHQGVIGLEWGSGPAEIGKRPPSRGDYVPSYYFAVDREGNLWFDDFPNNRLIKLSAQGEPLTQVQYSYLGLESGTDGYVMDLMCDKDNNLYVSIPRMIYKLDPKGQLLQTFEVIAPSDYEKVSTYSFYPRMKEFARVYIDNSGYVYTGKGILRESDTPTVLKFSPNGVWAESFSLPVGEPGVAFAATGEGYVYILPSRLFTTTGSLQVFAPDGAAMRTIDVSVHDWPYQAIPIFIIGTDLWGNVYICDMDITSALAQSWIIIYSQEGELLGQIDTPCGLNGGYVSPSGEIYMFSPPELYKMVPTDLSILQGH